MPQIIPVAAGAIAVAMGAGKLVTMAVMFASSIVAGFLQSALQDSPDKSSLDTGVLVNVRDTLAPLQIIYGEVRTGGCQVYVGATDDNKLLHIIQTIGEGEIDSVPSIYLGDRLSTDFGQYVHTEAYTGSAGQTVCSLHQYDPAFVDAMRRTAYLYVRLAYDRDKFQGLPLITSLVRGLKVYDPRTETVAWSNNPALCLYDFHTSSRYGAGLGPFWSNLTSVIDCANWCDAKGYTLNCAIASQEAAADIQERLLAGFRTRVVWSGYNFKLLPLDWDAPVMALTEDDIREGSWRTAIPSAQNIPNTLQVTYANRGHKYTSETFPLHDLGAINIDGEQHDQQLLLPGVVVKQLARKMGRYALKRLRMDRVHSFVGGPQCLSLEAGDMITVTHSTPGFVSAVVRVFSANPLPNDEVAISIQEEDPELYDDTDSVVDQLDYATTLPDPLSVVSAPSGVTFSEELYAVKDRTFSRIKCVFTAGSPYTDYVEVWISRDNVSWDFWTKAEGSFVHGPVADNELWYFRLVPVSIHGVRPDFATVTTYSYRVTGTVAVPANVAGFRASVAGDTIMLRWDAVDKTDFACYELRYGTEGVIDWAAALYFSALSAESLNLVGVKPGTHKFFIKARNTRSIYSSVAASYQVRVFDPPSYAQKFSQATDFAGGTHTNTEYADDAVYGRVLRVTHAGGLTGTWKSPQYDLGSVLVRRWWTLFDMAYAYADGTWENVLAGRTWADAFAGGLTWHQLLGDPAGGRVTMEFFYSEDGTAWHSTKDFHLLSSEVSARYVYYTVTIADGGENSYAYVKPVTLKGYYWA